MTCSRMLVALSTALVSGCGFDLDPVVLSGYATAGTSVYIYADDASGYNKADVDVDWVLERPSESETELISPRLYAVDIYLDHSGLFTIDRWVHNGASDVWTHRFYIEALPAAPVPVIDGPSRVDIGQRLELVGSASFDIDGLPLAYRWRLAFRPRDSAAELDTVEGERVFVTGDKAGIYSVELDVYNGRSWSESPAVHHIEVGE